MCHSGSRRADDRARWLYPDSPKKTSLRRVAPEFVDDGTIDLEQGIDPADHLQVPEFLDLSGSKATVGICLPCMSAYTCGAKGSG